MMAKSMAKSKPEQPVLTWRNETRRLSELVPWERNPRQIKDAEAERLGESLLQFGQVQTLAISPTGEIYDGHQRALVWSLLQDGGDRDVDVRVSSRALTEKEREKLVVYLHRGAQGEWNFEELANSFDFDELVEWGFDPGELVGFDFGNDKPANDDPGADLDKAAELQAKWNVKPGDLWLLGEHRLLCADCTDRAAVERVMGGEKAETLVFDPEWDAMPSALTGYLSTLAFCDGATLGAVTDRYGAPSWVFVWDCVSSWYVPNRPLRRMKICVWYGDIAAYQFDGWHYGDSGESRHVQNTRGDYVFQPDPRGKHLSDLFQAPITQLHSKELHNHSKPIDWITLLIANCTTGIVYDPFSGSGTTLIACERLNRRCRAIEIEPKYVAVALERWATMTGQTPVLDSNPTGDA